MICTRRFASCLKKGLLALCGVVAPLASPVSAQIPVPVQMGTPKYGSFGGGPADTLNLATLNAHIVIPILHKPGRGLPFDYDLTYDTTVWEPVTSGGTTAWHPVSSWGLNGSALNVGTQLSLIGYDGVNLYDCENQYVDGFGTSHWFVSGGSSDGSLWGCALYNTQTGANTPLNSTAQDGSGYTLTSTFCPNLCFSSPEFSLTAVNGNAIIPLGTIPLFPGAVAGSVQDRNGNEIVLAPSETSDAYKDTLGLTALTTSGGAPYPFTLTYTDPNGQAATVTVTYKPYPVKTVFACPGVSDYGLNNPVVNSLVDRLTLPNGTYYQFSYEATLGFPGDVTGRLASVTLPTGGTITYSYTGSNNGINCADGTAAGLSRQTPDGTWTYTRTIGTQGASTTTVQDPSSAQNQTVIQFPGICYKLDPSHPSSCTYAQGIYEGQRDVYQGKVSSGTKLETVITCYNLNAQNCNTATVTPPISQRNITTELWLSGTSFVASEHDYGYNQTYGMPTEVDDYDWGSGGRGSLIKKTLYAYANLGNIKSFAQKVTICKPGGADADCNSSGTKVAQTTNNYDERPPITTSSAIPNHLNLLPGTPRGNLTSVQRWLNTTGAPLTTQDVYFDTGKLESTADPNSNITSYSYSGAFAGAYLTQVGNALGQVTTKNYDANTGVLRSTTDPNGQTTTFAYDNMLRPTLTNYPDGGQTTICYSDEGGGTCTQSGPPYTVYTTTKITSGSNALSAVVTDSQGRTTQTQLDSDPSGTDYTDTTYDALGRVASLSNPHRSSSSPTDGITCYGTVSGGVCQKNGYDALGRITTITDQDGSVITSSYSGNCTTVTDEAGKTRKSCVDGVGRLTGLWEDPGSSPHLNYETDYAYDVLGNLMQVTQKGSGAPYRTRTYTYDSLSRLVCAADPEVQIATCPTTSNGTYTTGTIGYTYDPDGNVISKTAPKPNQTTASVTVNTTYTYDALSRLTQKSYGDGTPTVSYAYDGATPSCSVGSFTFGGNSIGRRTAICDGGGSEAWLYDSMGRVLSDQRITNSVTKTAAYTYNYDGTLATLGYPSGRTITYATNTAEQPISATDTTNNITYASNAHYAPFGGLSSLTNSTGISTTAYYDSRLQPCRFAVISSGTAPTSCADNTHAGNVLDQIYNFNLGTGDNGYVAKISDNRPAMSGLGRNISYTYDVLNRISSAYTDATSGTYAICEVYTIDAWSNLTAVNPKSGYTGTCYENFSQPQPGASNQLSSICTGGNCYDAPGNLLNDGNLSNLRYQYDAEARMCSVGVGVSGCTTGTTYYYDGDGRRVEKSNGTPYILYWYDTGNNVLDETDGSGKLTNEYIYFSGKRIARRQIR